MWGVLVHLVIPPFVFMVTEEWDYIEGLYYSFITISTIGFGDFVAGEPLPSPRSSASHLISVSPLQFPLSWPLLGTLIRVQCSGHFPYLVGSSSYPASCKGKLRHRKLSEESFLFPFFGCGFSPLLLSSPGV